MNALLIIDMQCGMFHDGRSPFEIDLVVERINRIAKRLRDAGKPVVFIQHSGESGGAFELGEPGWEFLPEIECAPTDLIVSKSTCDAFYNTELDSVLKGRGVDELLVCGWATDFCVDTTVRAAASLDYRITVITDAHTAADREHLDAASLIAHHNRVWEELIVPQRPIRLQSCDELMQQMPDSTLHSNHP